MESMTFVFGFWPISCIIISSCINFMVNIKLSFIFVTDWCLIMHTTLILLETQIHREKEIWRGISSSCWFTQSPKTLDHALLPCTSNGATVTWTIAHMGSWWLQGQNSATSPLDPTHENVFSHSFAYLIKFISSIFSR